MKVKEVIKNKDIFIQVRKNLKKVDKKRTYLEKNGYEMIYFSMMGLTFVNMFIYAPNLFMSIVKLMIAISTVAFFSLVLLNKIKPIMLDRAKSKSKSKLLTETAYNLTNDINTVFIGKKINKQFKELTKNPETKKCFKKINKIHKIRAYQQKTYFEKNIYKEILAYSIKENNVFDIEESKLDILKEIKSFPKKEQKIFEGLLVERLGLNAFVDIKNIEENNNIIIEKNVKNKEVEIKI